MLRERILQAREQSEQEIAKHAHYIVMLNRELAVVDARIAEDTNSNGQ